MVAVEAPVEPLVAVVDVVVEVSQHDVSDDVVDFVSAAVVDAAADRLYDAVEHDDVHVVVDDAVR